MVAKYGSSTRKHTLNVRSIAEIWAAAQASGKVISGFKLYDNFGKLFKEENFLETLEHLNQRYGYGSFIMAWADMQRLLAEKLPSGIPMHLGSQFER